MTLISALQAAFPGLRFAAGRQFFWSAETGEIIYNDSAEGAKADWSLLHETGHALLGHRDYRTDFELLRLEVAAWEKAKEVGAKVGIEIDEEHVQDCLDTYRDWLYRRSICPECATKCLQQDDGEQYRCFNCHTAWKVSSSRFARSYRRNASSLQTKA